jgi:hypothetical protein
MVWRRLIAAILLGLALLFGLQTASGQEPQESGYAGMDTCEICHEDVVKAFKKSPHWAAVRLGMPPGEGVGCESCHGPGEAHVQDAPEHIITFRDETARERVAQCASCHEGRSGMSFRRGIHVLAGQACDECHASGHDVSKIAVPKLCRFVIEPRTVCSSAATVMAFTESRSGAWKGMRRRKRARTVIVISRGPSCLSIWPIQLQGA